MPSISRKQANLMRAVAHNPAFAKKVGIPQSVGKDFSKADKGRKFGSGGTMKESKSMMKKEVAFMKKKGAPKSMIKHEEAEMGMKKGGKVKKYGIGGDIRDAWRRFTNPSPQERQAAERQFQDQVNARFAPGYNPANDPSAVRYYGLTPGFTGGSGSAGGASGPVAPPSGPSGPFARRGKRAGGKISSGFRHSADGIASKGKTRYGSSYGVGWFNILCFPSC